MVAHLARCQRPLGVEGSQTFVAAQLPHISSVISRNLDDAVRTRYHPEERKTLSVHTFLFLFSSIFDGCSGQVPKRPRLVVHVFFDGKLMARRILKN